MRTLADICFSKRIYLDLKILTNKYSSHLFPIYTSVNQFYNDILHKKQLVYG